MDVRLAKYSEFNPEPSKWCHDTRIFETATKGLEVLVAKNFSKHALPCIAIYPEMDLKTGQYKGFKVAAPDGPLKQYFEQEDTRKIFFGLLRDATIDAVAKKEQKRDGKEVRAGVTVLKTTAVTKPPRPIWTLTLKEIETFFSNLKTEVAKEDGIKLKPKWPKIVDNETVKLPTAIPSFDAVVEALIPSSVYIPFKKFPPGNLHWRLKLANAYILMKKKLDPNNFAEEIPEDFEPKKFDIKKLIELSENVEESAKVHHKRKKKPVEDNELTHVPFWAVDDVHIEEVLAEESEDFLEEESEPIDGLDVSVDIDIGPTNVDSICQPTASRSDSSTPSAEPPQSLSPMSRTAPSSSRTLPIPSLKRNNVQQSSLRDHHESCSVTIQEPANVMIDINEDDDLFNTSHGTGTPQNSHNSTVLDDEEVVEDDLFMANLEDEMENVHAYIDLMKSTDIKKLLSGEQDGQPVLQVFNFQSVTRAKCFKASGHDGKVITTKITFSSNIGEKVKDLQNKLPLIRLTNFVLYNGSFLFVKNFEVIKMCDTMLADLDYLTEEDYDEIKRISKPNPNLPQTPTLSMKKLTDKSVHQTTLPTRSSSQRITKRKPGNSC